MKHRLFFMFFYGTMSAGLMAQSVKDEVIIKGDLTSKIQNADFSQGTPVSTLVVNYDYNMPDAGAGAGGTGLFGMQAVTGWTASSPSDNIKVMESSSSTNRTDGANAKAAGLFAHADEDSGETGPGCGGDTYTAPYKDEASTGNTLGFVAVWGANLSYTQDVTLPAGDYLFEVKLANVSGGGVINKNNIGFVAADGKEYLSTTTTYIVGTNYQYDYVVFRLTQETSGKISLGYRSGNYGSSDAPHIFVDNVKLYSIDKSYIDAMEVSEAKVILYRLIEEGRYVGVNITESLKVYENANATLAEINAAIEKQRALNDAAYIDFSAYFLKNPHFTADTPLPDDNGITMYDYDMKDPNGANKRKVDYYGMQSVTSWEANHPGENSYASGVFSVGSNSFLGGAAYLPPLQMSDGSTEGNLLGLLTAWSATAQYTQQVTLPKGKYTLVMSYYNSGGAQAVAKNLIGFIADDGTEYLGSTTTFPVGKWTTDKVMFDLDDDTSGHFTMGYTATNTGSGNMPHLFIGGISVYSFGEKPKFFEINKINFPDENFRNYLLEQWYGKDGVITDEEIKYITYIYVSSKNISSLKGIEHFTALTELWCNDNSLTSLNVSKNTALTYLSCERNHIQGISMDAFINSLPNNINKGGVTFDDDGTGSGSLNDNYADGETSGSGNRLYIHNGSSDGNICTRSQVAAIKAKGWTPYYYDYEYEGCDDPTSVTVSVNSDGLTTYCPVFDVDFRYATDIAAYKASVSANTVYLEKVDAVAAGEGVLLRSLNGGEATEELPIEAAERHEDNAFVGTLDAIVLKEKVDNATNFILGWNSGTLGFYKANNTPLPAWQAYLPVENYNPAKALRMVFSDATDINEIIAPPATDDDAFYTLNGVRVTTPTNGIYIKNGKKVVVK